MLARAFCILATRRFPEPASPLTRTNLSWLLRTRAPPRLVRLIGKPALFPVYLFKIVIAFFCFVYVFNGSRIPCSTTLSAIPRSMAIIAGVGI